MRVQLPDAGCTTIPAVTLTTTTDPVTLCAQALTPFEQVISLDLSSLLSANYIAIVTASRHPSNCLDQANQRIHNNSND